MKDNLSNMERNRIIMERYNDIELRASDYAKHFDIFKSLLESGKLKTISGNALKFYIYLWLNHKKYFGYKWHSDKEITNYFGKSERTIRGWMKELEDFKLIERRSLKRKGKMYTSLIFYPFNTSSMLKPPDSELERAMKELGLDITDYL